MGFGPEFQEALKRKYDILQQNANTAAQDVAQKGGLQQQSDDAAQRRAQIAADTSLQSQAMQNQGAMDRAQLAS